VQNGRPPTYIVDDSPVVVPQAGGGDWTPQNYDGKFEGPMPMRRGLYQSRNIVAIKVGMELGPQSVIEMARKFGISTPIPPYPSIYIGSADVYPIEMVAAYSAFATLGTRAAPTAIVRVENSKGDVLWEPTPVRTPVMSPEEAWLMVSMMKDVVQRGTAAGSVGSQFHIPAGGKTGTTNDGADAWFIGYTPDVLMGVWVGFDERQPIVTKATGARIAAPVWARAMQRYIDGRRSGASWSRTPDVVDAMVDARTGFVLLAGCAASDGRSQRELFLRGREPVAVCPNPEDRARLEYAVLGDPAAVVEPTAQENGVRSYTPSRPPEPTPSPDPMNR
jgi:penicillin-binding protein 1A